MEDFIPDDKFVPDQAGAPAAPSTNALPDFIPDSQFVDDEEKYGSLGQQAITALEGAASSATFGLSTGLERSLGVPSEDILRRREENPIAHGAGQVGGILLPGGLAGKALGAIGKGAGALVGTSKIGSSVASLAAENAAFQVGDEVSRMFAGDPNQSLGTAMADVGLAGLIGGGIGVVPPLWNATIGSKLAEVLDAVKNKAGGIEGRLSEPVTDAIERVGIDIPPEVRAGLSDDPMLQNAFKTLEQSDTTKSGRALQETTNKIKKDFSDSMISSLGRTPEQVSKLVDISEANIGREMGDSLAKEVSEKFDPIIEKYDSFKNKFKGAEIESALTNQAAEKVGQMALDQGWLAASEGADRSLVNMVLRDLPQQKSLRDLSNLISQVGKRGEELSSPTNFGPSRTASMLKGVLRDVEDGIISTKLGEKGPQLVEDFRALQGSYRDASMLKDELTAKVGIKSSVGRYADSIREFVGTNSEKFLNRLTKENDASLLNLLKDKFPETAAKVREFQLDYALSKAVDKAKAGDLINAKALIKNIDNMTPEMKAFAIPEGALDKIRAVGTLLEQFEKAPHNFSNTARTMDKLLEYVPGAAVAMGTMAAGGNPALGALLGYMTKQLSKDVPDAARLSILKFLGSSAAVDAAGFRAMSDMVRSVYKGERAVYKATRAVLKPATKPDVKEVTQKDRDKLDKQLLALQADPMPLLNIAGDVGHYLPEYAGAMGETAARAVNYLNSLRPVKEKAMPLDPEMPVDPVKKAEFERALDIANSPLIVLENVKNGTVMEADLLTLQNVAPGLYARMREKLTEEMVNRTADDESIPYKTRLGLAMFLGQPLDSTMTPEAIQAAQPKPQMMAPPQGPMKPTQTGMQKLAKIGPSAATQSQSRAMDRAKRLS